jgi:microcompartment protein CcmL/EutN
MDTKNANLALGLIETQGYSGVIAAIDAATKTAAVEVRAVARASGGLILVALVGDVASVQVAVAAGAERAQAVGSLASSHVIARPDEQVWRALGLETKETQSQVAAAVVDDALPEDVKTHVPADDDIERLPVRELRHMARSLSVGLTGRQISNASREQILAAIRKARR